MQSVCMGRSRARRVLGPFFLDTAGILDTGFTRPHGGSAAHDPAAFPLSSDAVHLLVTRTILATALVTTLVTRFSPNSYVFL